MFQAAVLFPSHHENLFSAVCIHGRFPSLRNLRRDILRRHEEPIHGKSSSLIFYADRNIRERMRNLSDLQYLLQVHGFFPVLCGVLLPVFCNSAYNSITCIGRTWYYAKNPPTIRVCKST